MVRCFLLLASLKNTILFPSNLGIIISVSILDKLHTRVNHNYLSNHLMLLKTFYPNISKIHQEVGSKLLIYTPVHNTFIHISDIYFQFSVVVLFPLFPFLRDLYILLDTWTILNEITWPIFTNIVLIYFNACHNLNSK